MNKEDLDKLYEVYDELGLTDEENLLFGYGGQYSITTEGE